MASPAPISFSLPALGTAWNPSLAPPFTLLEAAAAANTGAPSPQTSTPPSPFRDLGPNPFVSPPQLTAPLQGALGPPPLHPASSPTAKGQRSSRPPSRQGQTSQLLRDGIEDLSQRVESLQEDVREMSSYLNEMTQRGCMLTSPPPAPVIAAPPPPPASVRFTPEYGAPIKNYADPRLYGYTLMRLWRSLYYCWVKPVGGWVFDPTQNRVVEFARRLFSAMIGVALMAVISPLLIGRLVQVIHYHLLSSKEIDKPKFERNGWKPEFVLGDELFYNAELRAMACSWQVDCSTNHAIKTLRTAGSSEAPEESAERRLHGSYHCEPGEIALVSEDEWLRIKNDQSKQDLLLLNGFRCIFSSSHKKLQLDPYVSTITGISRVPPSLSAPG